MKTCGVNTDMVVTFTYRIINRGIEDKHSIGATDDTTYVEMFVFVFH